MSIQLNSRYNKLTEDNEEIDYLNDDSIKKASTPLYKNNKSNNHMDDLFSLFNSDNSIENKKQSKSNYNNEVNTPDVSNSPSSPSDEDDEHVGIISHVLDSIYGISLSFLQLISIKNRRLFLPGIKYSLYTLVHGINFNDGSSCISCNI